MEDEQKGIIKEKKGNPPVYLFPITRKEDRFGVVKSFNGWLHRPYTYYFLIESMVYNIQVVHWTGQKLCLF